MGMMAERADAAEDGQLEVLNLDRARAVQVEVAEQRLHVLLAHILRVRAPLLVRAELTTSHFWLTSVVACCQSTTSGQEPSGLGNKPRRHRPRKSKARLRQNHQPTGCGLESRTMMAMPLRHVLNSSSVILLSAEPEL